MRHEEIAELAAVYALGALEGEDRARFEALLEAGDAEAMAALRESEAALAGLATEVAAAPPPGVKAGLMARLAAEGGPEGAGVGAAPGPSRRRAPAALWPAVWAGVLAAGLAAVAIGLTVSAGYDRRLRDLARETAVLREALERQQSVLAILRDPGTQMVALAGQAPAPSARGRMLWHARAGGLLVVAGLPRLPEGKTYQLWAIRGKNPPVPAGLFDVDDRGAGSVQVPPLPGVGEVDVFAVTREPAGGLAAPSGAVYLAGKS
jgi:anti-sigma-K factor RskA